MRSRRTGSISPPDLLPPQIWFGCRTARARNLESAARHRKREHHQQAKLRARTTWRFKRVRGRKCSKVVTFYREACKRKNSRLGALPNCRHASAPILQSLASGPDSSEFRFARTRGADRADAKAWLSRGGRICWPYKHAYRDVALHSRRTGALKKKTVARPSPSAVEKVIKFPKQSRQANLQSPRENVVCPRRCSRNNNDSALFLLEAPKINRQRVNPVEIYSARPWRYMKGSLTRTRAIRSASNAPSPPSPPCCSMIKR